MDIKSLLGELCDKNDKKAYERCKELILEIESSDKYYNYLEDFLKFLDSDNSFIRTRGFMICSALLKWDKDNKIVFVLPKMLELLNDEKPTVIRQCIKELENLVMVKPNICDLISERINKIDINQYKDSVNMLIQKDIYRLNKIIEEVKNEC